MATKLMEADVQSRLAKVPGWTIENGQLTRTFKLDTFPAALVFVNAVGHLAESAKHHPDIDIRYRSVKLALTTHDSGGLTEKDFALAARINEIAGQG